MTRQQVHTQLAQLSVVGAWSMFLLITFWLAFTAGIRPLSLPDEGRYVGVAWEMLSSGNWGVPTIDGMPFFHKPPLFYWLDILSMTLFGVSDWSARAASIVGGLAGAGGLYLFVRTHRDARLATLAALILITQPFYFVGAQFANLDMLVAGMISATILFGAHAVLRFEQQRPYRATLAATYGLAAFGVLAKGLIGIVLPGAILMAWILWRHSWRCWRVALWPLGWLVFSVIALPWFFWMQHLYPGFFDYFVVYHHFRRFAETGFNNQNPFWFYGPILLLLTLPWSPWFARFSSWSCWRASEPAPLRSLMVFWLGGIVVFFSLPSSKLVGYILPALPPFAYLLAEMFSDWIEKDPARGRKWYLITLGVAATVCVAIVLSISVAQRGESALAMALEARTHLRPEDQLVMLDKYQYDAAFYLRTPTAPWVISKWDDPAIPTVDNWRKELLDAGQFDPQVARKQLVSIAEFERRACAMKTGALWLWGTAHSSSELPWLLDQPPFAQDRRHILWRLDPARINSLLSCGETPTDG